MLAPLSPALCLPQMGVVSLYFAWYLLYIYRAFYQLRIAPYSTFRLGHLMLRLQVFNSAGLALTWSTIGICSAKHVGRTLCRYLRS